MSTKVSATNPAAMSSSILKVRRKIILHEDDVVLIDAVQRFGLQPYRDARDQLELAERGGLLVEQALDHVLMGQDHQLPTLELTRLTHDLAKYLVADGLDRLDEPPALARRTSLAQQMFQTFAGAFARHLHEPERRDRGDVGLHVVVRERLLQRLDHLPA